MTPWSSCEPLLSKNFAPLAPASLFIPLVALIVALVVTMAVFAVMAMAMAVAVAVAVVFFQFLKPWSPCR